ncbi:MAG: hypothetical protein KatS3mg085_066 [Candidatus Dojkabacteria bacterium]|nr:MAG: hypothetical protein KatS3mg085_066 [Candidatus Dojkabacteria bacterium]
MKKTKRIGFISDDLKPYNDAWASTRLRVYNVINHFKKKYFLRYKLEIYNESQKYDAVIFQKAYFGEFLTIAKKLKNQGTLIIFDINIDVFALEADIGIFNEEQIQKINQMKKDIKDMLNLADCIIVSSEHLQQIYSQYNKLTFLIEEAIEDKFIKTNKIHENTDMINLLYNGYSKKAKDISLISEILIELQNKYKNLNLLFVSDQKPEIDFIPNTFIKFNFKTVHKSFLRGDIKIAPRDLSVPYNLGHALSKVAYPMAVGLPVVASPVPSYLNRGITICRSDEEWYSALSNLIENYELRRIIGRRNKEYIKSNLTMKQVGKQYFELFNFLLN